MSAPTITTSAHEVVVWEVRALPTGAVVMQTPDLEQAGQAVAALGEAGCSAAIHRSAPDSPAIPETRGDLQVLGASELRGEHVDQHVWLFSPQVDVLAGRLLWACPLSGHAGHVSMVLLGVAVSLGVGLSYEAEVPVNLDFPVVVVAA